MGFDLAAFLPYQLAVAASRVSRGFSEGYKAEFGLSIPEWRVLAHLAQSDSVSIREIHARVDMDKSKVSRAAAEHQGRAVSRKVLLEKVWDLQEDTDTRAIDNFIVRLRRHLEDEPNKPKIVQTVGGVGYKFIKE